MTNTILLIYTHINNIICSKGVINVNEDLITLIDEEGVEHQFEVETLLEVSDEKYAVLIPMDEEYTDTNEAIIMRFGVDEQGEEILIDVDSDEEWDRVADAYDEYVNSLEQDEEKLEDEDF